MPYGYGNEGRSDSLIDSPREKHPGRQCFLLIEVEKKRAHDLDKPRRFMFDARSHQFLGHGDRLGLSDGDSGRQLFAAVVDRVDFSDCKSEGGFVKFIDTALECAVERAEQFGIACGKHSVVVFHSVANRVKLPALLVELEQQRVDLAFPFRDFLGNLGVDERVEPTVDISADIVGRIRLGFDDGSLHSDDGCCRSVDMIGHTVNAFGHGLGVDNTIYNSHRSVIVRGLLGSVVRLDLRFLLAE